MARVTIEDCLEKINNHFKLVLVASHRAQQLQTGVAPKIEAGNDKPTIIALREIAEGLVDESILDEPLAQDTTAEEELADLIAHGLMNQEVATELGEVADESDEEEDLAEPDTLETGTETIEEMEKIADLNLDHLKADGDTPAKSDSDLAEELSASEIEIGEKLLSQAGEMTGETAGETTNETAGDLNAADAGTGAGADAGDATGETADTAASESVGVGEDGDKPGEENEPAAEKPV